MSNQDILCQYQAGEERGIWLLRQLQTFAPDEQTAAIIGEQILDEQKHDRLFSERLADLDIDCEGLNNSLTSLYDFAQECVDEKDWVKSIAIQAVIEELAMSTFTQRLPELDEDTQVVLQEIINDEVKHLTFGINELEKVREGNEEKIRSVHLRVLELFMKSFKDGSFPKEDLPILLNTFQTAYRMHKGRLDRIGIELPEVSSLMALALQS